MWFSKESFAYKIHFTEKSKSFSKQKGENMEKPIESIVEEYRVRKIDRRDFFTRLIAVTGTYATAHLFLEQSGLAATLVSEIESQKADVDSSTVEYMNGDVKLSGYLSKPKAKGTYPAILVIHENRGLNDHTRDVARRFAAEGYVALAVDALARKGGTAAMDTPEKVREAFGSISAADVMGDMNAGLSYLNKQANVKKDKLASIGFCWGGARSFLLATEENKLAAAVVFYGSAPTDEQLAKVHCPVFGVYGETDERITGAVPKVEETMKKLGKSYEYKIYKGAAHAFFNDTGQRYNAEAAKDAWTQTLAFLKKNLK
jgi:carboxymethylenebutenolidase